MKNLLKILLAVVALAVVGCTTDTTEDLAVNISKGDGLTTVTLSLDGTRTHLGAKGEEGYPLYWSKGDKIALNGVASAALGEEFDGQAAATFTFEGELTAPYNVVYPAPAEGVTASAEGLYPVVFPASQVYTEGGFANGAAPLYGYAGLAAEGEEVGAIEIGHLTGVLRFAVKGDVTLRTLTITTEKGCIAGTFDVDCSNGSLTPQEGASNTVTMSFGDGLALNAETATPIYVTVPAGDYGKFYVMLSTTTDIMKLTFGSTAKPVKAGVVREFAEFSYAANVNENDIYLIDSKEALIHFAEIASNFPPYTSAKVVAPIDMTGEAWSPIEGFGAFIFDGGEFEIKGLTAPLFGSTAGIIKNVKLTGVNINETEAAFTGAIARRLYGSLNNCSAAGAINVNNTTLVLESYTNQYSDIAHGGLVGFASGATIYNCTNDIDITVTSFCAADFSCKTAFGGVVGVTENESKFNGLTNNGDVVYNGTTQKGNFYFSGVIGKQSTVSGQVAIGELNNCTNNGAVYTTEGSKGGASILMAGVIGDVDFGTASKVADNLVNNGAITIKGECTDNRMAGVIAYHSVGSFTNCKNTGAISAAKGAKANQCYIGGVFGGSMSLGTMSNCTNEGALSVADGIAFNGYVWLSGVATLVTAASTDIPTITNCVNKGALSIGSSTNKNTGNGGRLYMSGVFGQINAGNISKCYNEATGTITANTGSWGSGYMVGGFTGYFSTKSGITTITVTDCENKADITLGQIEGAGAPYAEVGGIVGEAYVGSGDYTVKLIRVKNSGNLTLNGTYTKANYPYFGGLMGVNNYTTVELKDCENSGNVTYAATAPNASVGGIFGYDTNNTSFTIDGCVNSGNITYSAIAGTHVNLGGFGGYRNVGKPTVIKNSTNLGSVILSGEQTATAEDSWAYAVAGFVGRNTGNGLSVTDSTNGKSGDATKGTVTVGTAPSGIGLAGVVGISTSVVTITGCKNYGTISQTGKGSQDKAYRAHIAGILGTTANAINFTITNCENYGTVEYGTVAPVNRVDVAGIVATSPADATAVTITNCKNGGVIAYKAANSGAEISVGGIGGTLQHNATLKDCVNLASGKIVASGSATTNYEFGGVAGSIVTASTVVDNCDNYGTVDQTVASKGTTQIGGVIGYAYTFKTITGCDNYGKVIFSGTSGTNANAGGVVGYARFKASADGVATISNCGNYCDLEFAGKAKDYYVGGVVGYCRGVESGTAKLENLKNIANLTFKSKGSTSTYLGGICGTFGSETNGHTLEGGVFYGTVTALGLKGEFGIGFGNTRTDNRYVKDVEAGGKLIYEEVTSEDAGGNEETLPVEIPITAENLREHLYTDKVDAAVVAADGCSVLTTKPAVPAN